MLTRQILDQSHLGFGDFISVNSRHPNAFLMDVEHDLDGLCLFFVENILEDLHNEFLGSIVVIVQQNFVEGRLF